MKVVTAHEMQEIDRITIQEKGLSGSVLMGLAGKSVADYIIRNIKNISEVIIFAGTGNNGGDGFVTAYFLLNANIKVKIYLTGTKEKVSETSRMYMNLCLNSGLDIIELNETNRDSIEFNQYNFIVDAMLGTGFEGKVRGIIGDIIKKINNSGITVLSIDVPSGLNSDGYTPEGDVIKADYTVTIGLPKISLVTYPGKEYTGELSVSDIGFPYYLVNSEKILVDLIDETYFNTFLSTGLYPLSGNEDIHKTEKGHLLLIGGFDGMEGAIIMTAMAAMESGVGMLTLLTSEKARTIIAGVIPELITDDFIYQLNQERKSRQEFLEDQLRMFFENKKYDALVIGPGMGRDDKAIDLFGLIIDNLYDYGIKRILIDGDGLFLLAEYLKTKTIDKRVGVIITPHFMEAARLLNKNIQEIKNNRLLTAKSLAQAASATALLKGPSTIVSDGVHALINTTGNQILATAGSGDILSGIIGSLMLKDISTIHAASIGAYIHGKAADMYYEENQCFSMKATDIVKYIRKVLRKGNSF